MNREQFELAALAVGFQWNPSMVSPLGLFGCYTTDDSQTMYLWNPLTSAEDSERLGAALELDVLWFFDTVEVEHSIRNASLNIVERITITERHDDTPQGRIRALRLARLRVAEEVGRRMRDA